MRHQEVDPPEALRNVIKCFWHTSLDFEVLPTDFEVLPDGYAEIIFYFGTSCSILSQGGWQQLPSPFLVGLLNQPAVFHADSQLDILGVRCFPWMVFELLNLPSGQDGVRIMEHPLARLQPTLSALVQQGRIPEALAQLTQHFLAAGLPPAGSPLLGRAGEAMHAAHGTLPVRAVAAAAHATVRTLERQFKRAAGYTVKDVSGLMRFEQVRNHLWQHPEANLAALAQELGYADQAHLSREFKRYSGTTPAAFARSIRRGRAASPLNFVAFIQA